MMNPNPFQGYAPDPMRAQGPAIGRSQDTTDERLAFCMRELVPIWERWTDGNQALRCYLEDASNPASHDERSRVLMQPANELSQRGGKTRSVKAALAAVLACLQAHRSTPRDEWQKAGGHALHLDILAQGELREMQELLDISLPSGPS